MIRLGRMDQVYIKGVAPELRDLDVYLTEERKRHIIEHHPETEKMMDMLSGVIENPDFTQRNRKQYAIRFYKFYKELKVGERNLHNKFLMCIVRLNVNLPSGYRNSVITFHLLSEPKGGEIIWQRGS